MPTSSPHIPYRNSKLTRILQSALSGNARISVICTINPTFASKDESLNTLRFAQRTKLVKTAAKMTRIIDNSELQNCLLKIAELQTKMQEKNDVSFTQLFCYIDIVSKHVDIYSWRLKHENVSKAY